MSDIEALKNKNLLTHDEAYTYMGLSNSAFWCYRKIQDFPKPIEILGRQYFKREEIDTWCIKYRFYYRGDTLNMEHLKARDLLTMRETCFYLGISYGTIYRHEKYGGFPRRIQIYRQRVLYRREELDEWLKTYERNKTVKKPKA